VKKKKGRGKKSPSWKQVFETPELRKFRSLK
jgi:hypothetical protein